MDAEQEIRAIEIATGWYVWTVRMIMPAGLTWHAYPPDGVCGVVHAGSPKELRKAITAWQSRTPEEVDAHIRYLRQMYDRAGGDYERDHLSKRIAAEC